MQSCASCLDDDSDSKTATQSCCGSPLQVYLRPTGSHCEGFIAENTPFYGHANHEVQLDDHLILNALKTRRTNSSSVSRCSRTVAFSIDLFVIMTFVSSCVLFPPFTCGEHTS